MIATLVSACCWLCSPTRPLTQRGERGEPTRGITGAGHLDGKVVPRRGEPQQPVQAGPDHIGADQHQQPGAQVRRRLGGVGADQPPPVRLVFGAAGAPPLLPTVAGLVRSQPSTVSTPNRRFCWLCGLSNANGAASTRSTTADRLASVAGHDDAIGRGGNNAASCAPVDFADPATAGADGGSRRQHLRVGDHDPASPKRIARLSARYPGAGGVAGSRSRRRA